MAFNISSKQLLSVNQKFISINKLVNILPLFLIIKKTFRKLFSQHNDHTQIKTFAPLLSVCDNLHTDHMHMTSAPNNAVYFIVGIL